jgi:hypothetical protein
MCIWEHHLTSITFDIWRLRYQDILVVHGVEEKMIPVYEIKNHQILTGIWHRRSRVSAPTEQGDRIKIVYVEGTGFSMQVLG